MGGGEEVKVGNLVTTFQFFDYKFVFFVARDKRGTFTGLSFKYPLPSMTHQKQK